MEKKTKKQKTPCKSQEEEGVPKSANRKQGTIGFVPEGDTHQGKKKLKHKPKRSLRITNDPDEDDEEEEKITLLTEDELEAIMNAEDGHLVQKMQAACLLKSKKREKRGLTYIS